MSSMPNRRPAAAEVIGDDGWISDTYIPTVQQRGAAVIAARGASSAAKRGQRLHQSRAELVCRRCRGRLGEHGHPQHRRVWLARRCDL